MNNQELLEYNKNRVVSQICIATDREIDEVLQEWVDILKVGPWTVYELSDETIQDPRWNDEPVTEPFKYKCALATYGNIQVEIVQPISGFTGATPFVDRVGTGFQHFKEKISDEDIEGKIEEFKAAGLKGTNSGHIAADYFYNFDSESTLGVAFEVGNGAPDIEFDKDKYYVFPRE